MREALEKKREELLTSKEDFADRLSRTQAELAKEKDKSIVLGDKAKYAGATASVQVNVTLIPALTASVLVLPGTTRRCT